ncbi:MAG: hypothetical protein RL274_662 [Pseudomonadota bacterium]
MKTASTGAPGYKVKSQSRINPAPKVCFNLAHPLPTTARWAAWGSFFPRNVAQLTGVIVAGIVAFGTDTDIFLAVPLGVFAGALAALFVSISDAREAYNARWDNKTRR